MVEIFYVVLCLVVAMFAIGQRGGFLLYFILSLVMTPLVGLLILLVVGNRKSQETSARTESPGR